MADTMNEHNVSPISLLVKMVLTNRGHNNLHVSVENKRNSCRTKIIIILDIRTSSFHSFQNGYKWIMYKMSCQILNNSNFNFCSNKVRSLLRTMAMITSTDIFLPLVI